MWRTLCAVPQEENRLLKMLLNTARNGAPDSDAVGGNNL